MMNGAGRTFGFTVYILCCTLNQYASATAAELPAVASEAATPCFLPSASDLSQASNWACQPYTMRLNVIQFAA